MNLIKFICICTFALTAQKMKNMKKDNSTCMWLNIEHMNMSVCELRKRQLNITIKTIDAYDKIKKRATKPSEAYHCLLLTLRQSCFDYVEKLFAINKTISE